MDDITSSKKEHSPLNEHEMRLQKIKLMKEKNIEPWPEYKEVTATCAEARAEFENGKDETKSYTLAGRLHAIREHGKTIFATIHDRSGALQIYLRADALGDEQFSFFKQLIDLGDIIWVQGTLFITKMGELTLKVQEFSLLSKCLHPLPEKYHGLTDIEQRYRQRYLDFISNQKSKEKFLTRSKIIHSIRDFLTKHDFIEVETPMLHPIPGGATARPFITHHNAYDMDLFLRIAPELYLKRLVIGGFERVFEINRNFRNEGVSTKHNPEFTMLEFYMAHGDYTKGMELTEKLVRAAVQSSGGAMTRLFKDREIDFSKPFKKLTVYESLKTVGGFSEDELAAENITHLLQKVAHSVMSPHAHYGEKLWALFEAVVEDKLFEPTFIIGHPVEVSPLAKRNPQDPHTVSRFELFVGGFELANGFTELNDPFDQAQRFKMQVEQSEAGNDEAHKYDADYVHALEYGLPPTVGVGIGIDRLVMLLTNTASIKDVILFPTLKISKPTTQESATEE